jgi:hypothetical protein
MTLNEWLIELSGMLDDELKDDASLELSLEWFGNLPGDVLDTLNVSAQKNSTLRDFLTVGAHLLEEYEP